MHAIAGGSGGMPSQETSEICCSEITLEISLFCFYFHLFFFPVILFFPTYYA